nr:MULTISPECIES: hypothetical protein [unclassified Pseudonocardia]
MVLSLDPGGEQAVELGQIGDLGGPIGSDLDEELLPDGAEEALDFSPALGSARGGMDQLDAEAGTAAQQPRVDKR